MNPVAEKGDILRHYGGLSSNVQERAWHSYNDWLENPKWEGAKNPLLKKMMFSDLIKSKYFFPASDGNLVGEIFKSVMKRNKNEYFMMIRLSQHKQHPLVWALAQGGINMIIKVRIGVQLMPATKTSPVAINYMVATTDDSIHQSTNLQAIVETLRVYYVKPKRSYAWPLLSNLMTIQPVVE